MSLVILRHSLRRIAASVPSRPPRIAVPRKFSGQPAAKPTGPETPKHAGLAESAIKKSGTEIGTTPAQPPSTPTSGSTAGQNTPPVESAASAVPKPAQAPSTAADSTAIPDVPSSSLGLFEEADAKDPNKWKKFAWKYVGAVLLFFVSYKTLHWYVDRVEASGKKRREEMEENKTIAAELRAKDAQPFVNMRQKQTLDAQPTLGPQPMLAAQPTIPASSPSVADAAMAVEERPGIAQQIENIPVSSSELDELYAMRMQFQNELADMQRDSSSAASKERMVNIEAELDALELEISELESRRSRS